MLGLSRTVGELDGEIEGTFIFQGMSLLTVVLATGGDLLLPT
jgi:hypothetical protein